MDRFAVQIVTASGEVVTENDPETGAPLALVDLPPQPGGGSQSIAASNLLLVVDTGRRFPGAPAA